MPYGQKGEKNFFVHPQKTNSLMKKFSKPSLNIPEKIPQTNIMNIKYCKQSFHGDIAAFLYAPILNIRTNSLYVTILV